MEVNITRKERVRWTDRHANGRNEMVGNTARQRQKTSYLGRDERAGTRMQWYRARRRKVKKETKWKKQGNKKSKQITKRAKLYVQKQIDKYKPVTEKYRIEEENGERKSAEEEDGRFFIRLQRILLNNTASEAQISRRSCYLIQPTRISLQRILLNNTASDVADSFSQSIL